MNWITEKILKARESMNSFHEWCDLFKRTHTSDEFKMLFYYYQNYRDICERDGCKPIQINDWFYNYYCDGVYSRANFNAKTFVYCCKNR